MRKLRRRTSGNGDSPVVPRPMPGASDSPSTARRFGRCHFVPVARSEGVACRIPGKRRCRMRCRRRERNRSRRVRHTPTGNGSPLPRPPEPCPSAWSVGLTPFQRVRNRPRTPSPRVRRHVLPPVPRVVAPHLPWRSPRAVRTRSRGEAPSRGEVGRVSRRPYEAGRAACRSRPVGPRARPASLPSRTAPGGQRSIGLGAVLHRCDAPGGFVLFARDWRGT